MYVPGVVGLTVKFGDEDKALKELPTIFPPVGASYQLIKLPVEVAYKVTGTPVQVV